MIFWVCAALSESLHGNLLVLQGGTSCIVKRIVHTVCDAISHLAIASLVVMLYLVNTGTTDQWCKRQRLHVAAWPVPKPMP